MKSRTISVRRRQLMVAGLAGTAAPALAGQLHAAVGELGAIEREGGLVVSGRIVAENGSPLTGAAIEIWHANTREHPATATTDGDGRFFAKVASDSTGRPRHIHYRVSHAGQVPAAGQLHFARGRSLAEHDAGRLHRDESGAWRAAFGVTLA